MHVFAHFLQPIAERRPGGRLDELNLGGMMRYECRPSHAGIRAARKSVVANDGILQLSRIEDAQHLGPVIDRLVEVFDQHTNMSERSTGHDVSPENALSKWSVRPV